MANTPVNKELYTRVKAEAKRKFKSWPSAYGSAWLVKEYKKRGGKYRTSSKQSGGMSDTALDRMQSFYKDMQTNAFDASDFIANLENIVDLSDKNNRTEYLSSVKGPGLFGTGLFGKNYYKGPGLFSYDPYYLEDNVNVQKGIDEFGDRIYVPYKEYNDSNIVNSQKNMLEYSSGGGIPERYKNMGFTKVGAKKKSTRPGKKWMVLAKKGDDYKVVHGGYKGMQDFKQHGSAERKKRFWDRMGGRDSAKAKDPFSPLYWHKRFGTWQEGGQFIYDPNNLMPQFEMGNSILDKMKRETMRKGGQPCYECGGMYATGGTNNPGFRALPPHVQQKIRANMNSGGMTPFNADPNYYGERLEKFIGDIRNTAAENLFPDMEEEVMQMPQARYGMPIYQDAGSIDSEPLYLYDSAGNPITNINDVAIGTKLYGPPGDGGSVYIGTYRGNGQYETIIGGRSQSPVIRYLADYLPDFSASWSQSVIDEKENIPTTVKKDKEEEEIAAVPDADPKDELLEREKGEDFEDELPEGYDDFLEGKMEEFRVDKAAKDKLLEQEPGIQMYGQPDPYPVYLKKYRRGPFSTVAKFRPYPMTGGYNPNEQPDLNMGDENIITRLQERLLGSRDARRMRRQESREMRNNQRENLREMRDAANDIIKGSNMQKREEMFDAKMDMRDERFNDRMDRRSNRINERFDRRIERNQDQLERFQDRMQRKEDRRNRKVEQGGMSNPYLYMYKEGGEYYMDENTINMIMAMGGDIEFLD